ncbi:hypothetical protein ACFCZV_05990 [Streptomyces hydrogenans]|uniref:hypothetical protein n=1 Tax=Streptomyces hydrogenans TaxID=1873719 RepID=UPI0035DBFA7C
MISEPELEGGAPFGTTEVLTEEREPRPRRSVPRPLWALGGALAASALWAGGLYAYDAGRPDGGVDLGGFQGVEDLCERAGLKGLGMVLGERGATGPGPFLDDPVLSESSCSVNYGRGDREQSVEVRYTLHKGADPGIEFAARAKHEGLLLPVAGVGEQAFFGDRGEDGGTLRVLDGQAVVQLDLYRSWYENEDGETVDQSALDLSGIDVPMTQDALELLAALKK